MIRTTCYHCHERQPAEGSVFCAECQPEAKKPRPIETWPCFALDERRGLRETPGFLRRLFAAIFSPELAECQKDALAALQDAETANLALRKRLADCKASNAEMLKAVQDHKAADVVSRVLVESITEERDTAVSAVRRFRAELDCCHVFIRDIRDNYDCDTGVNGTHSIQCRKCTAERLMKGGAQ